jgi:hypothetical protein
MTKYWGLEVAGFQDGALATYPDTGLLGRGAR